MEDIERFLLKEQFADEEEVLRTKSIMSERVYQEYLADEACINWAYDYAFGCHETRPRRRSEHPKTDWRKELMKHFGVVDPLVIEEMTEEEEEEWRKCTSMHPNYNNAKKNNKKKEKIEEKIRVKNREKNRKKNRKRREKRQLKSKNKDHDAQDNEKQEIPLQILLPS